MPTRSRSSAISAYCDGVHVRGHMTVYFNKRRLRWCFDFERGGKRYSGYCVGPDGQPVTSKRAAAEAEAAEKRKADLKPKVPQARDVTVAQIVADLSAAWKHEQNWENRKLYLREFMAYFGEGRVIASIAESECDDYKSWLLRQPVLVWKGGAKRKRTDPDAEKYWKPSGRTRAPSTVNRYLPVARAIFERAYKLRDPLSGERVIAEVPVIEDLDEPKRKARPIPDAILTFILENVPQHTREALTASLHFGFRLGEVHGLQVANVDFDNGGVWLEHDAVKDDEDAFQPGSIEAMAFMKHLVDQAKARNTTFLITWKRAYLDEKVAATKPWMPLADPHRAWNTVMDKVEKAFGRRYRWHDVRAAYISRIANHVGRLPAQKLARHSDYRTTEAYVLLEDELMRSAANMASARPALLKMVKG